ncbi:MAG: CheR family methyltransferase, partial [Bacteroidia bacterium]
TIKAWVVATSSGEEAYSIAILFHEQLEKQNTPDVVVKIFATDVDKDALETASKGVYPRSILETVSGQRIAKYFDVEGEGYKVKPDLRKMVVFSSHDVLKDPPFGRLDLVCCRNMLIYINPETQKEILRKLHFALNLNGYLFVGPSEHVDVIKSSLEEVDKKWRIYKCVSKARLDQQPFFQAFDKSSLIRTAAEAKAKNPLHHLGDLFKETLLEDESYAGIFIDVNFDVKQAVGNYKNYIHFPEVHFNFNLLKLVPADLSIALSAAVRKAIQENSPVNVKGVKIHTEKKTRIVHLHVKPYLHHNVYAQQFLFIVLKDEDQRELPPPVPSQLPQTELARNEELERELRDTRENLQAMIEEMEATNEELQSANEEMVSANEELQSTNEELQSLNEELHTVSVEHQLKIKELMELNDDLNNYFRNSDIGQILVDKNFIVRKFSPSVTSMVNLIPSDVHRSLLDITTRFKGVDFIGNISQVIRTGMPSEKEITVDDYVYLLRITPYERHDKKIDGVVINFIDITHTKQIDSFLDAIFKSVPSAILAAKAIRSERKEISDFEFIAANPAAETNLGHKREEIIGKRLKQLFPSNAKEIGKYYLDVVETGKLKSYDFFNEHLNKWNNVVLVKFLDGVVSVSTDITEKKKAADLVEKNYEELRKSLKLNKKKN